MARNDGKILDCSRGVEPPTDTRPHAALLDRLPRDLGALCATEFRDLLQADD